MAPHRIDTHHHPYPPVYVEKTRDILKRTTHTFYDRLTTWQPSHAVEAMDKDGIAVSVLSIGTPSVWLGDVQASRTLARECNDAAAKMQSDYKGRFGHFATIPLPDVDGSPARDRISLRHARRGRHRADHQLRRQVSRRGRLRAGVRRTQPPQRGGVFPSDRGELRVQPRQGYPAADHRIPVRHHAHHHQPLFSGTFSRCPNIRWIFSHGGGALGMVANRLAGLAKNRPELAARVPNGVKAELSKLYLDVVGVTTPGALAAVLDIVPMSQLLFGTDYPFWAPDITVNGLAALKLVAADLAAIERGNALTLMPGLGK